MIWLILGIPFALVLMFAAWYDRKVKKQFKQNAQTMTNADYAYAQSMSNAQYNSMANSGVNGSASPGGSGS
ncbi:hypothetical protein QTG56_26140 (plasmid) [Rossellomorea sp. AcN35-11]|nr:hypothetical protein [Rossellomorea aquimaris]WJV32098.1 hypothetical protein QTG56_26140 [Rossellomorea sp. AcN35-11]